MTTATLQSVRFEYVSLLDHVECQVHYEDADGDHRCVVANLDLSLVHDLLGQLGDAAAAAEFAAEAE